MTDTSKTLRDAAQYIEKHGWTKGTLKDARGSVCALGAIRYATYENAGIGDLYASIGDAGVMDVVREDQRAACEALAATVADMTGRDTRPMSIPQWNDGSSTTKEDVILMFKHAAERAESE